MAATGMSMVLVVEDDRPTAVLVREILKLDGYRVRHAVGAAGIDAARRRASGGDRRRAETRDIILLDINVPGMGSPEVSQHLRAAAVTACDQR